MGVLLAAAGLLFVLMLAMGTGLMPDGTDATLVGVDLRSLLTVAAGIFLAGGITLVGLGFGHWRRPQRPGASLDRTPDKQGRRDADRARA